MADRLPVGLIRVLTTTDSELLNLHGKLVMENFPGFEVLSSCIPGQPEGIHDDETEKTAVPKVMALARQMEADGMRAVIISCAGDPAVRQAVAELGIPVIGAGRAAACMALALGRPVGVLGITEKVPQAIIDILGTNLAADAVPEGVGSTLDLMRPGGMDAVYKAGRGLMDKGARALLLACTGLSTIGAADKLQKSLGIPVIDPVRAEAAALWAALGS